jgi:hypothetical protein
LLGLPWSLVIRDSSTAFGDAETATTAADIRVAKKKDFKTMVA